MGSSSFHRRRVITTIIHVEFVSALEEREKANFLPPLAPNTKPPTKLSPRKRPRGGAHLLEHAVSHPFLLVWQRSCPPRRRAFIPRYVGNQHPNATPPRHHHRAHPVHRAACRGPAKMHISYAVFLSAVCLACRAKVQILPRDLKILRSPMSRLVGVIIDRHHEIIIIIS